MTWLVEICLEIFFGYMHLWKSVKRVSNYFTSSALDVQEKQEKFPRVQTQDFSFSATLQSQVTQDQPVGKLRWEKIQLRYRNPHNFAIFLTTERDSQVDEPCKNSKLFLQQILSEHYLVIALCFLGIMYQWLKLLHVCV